LVVHVEQVPSGLSLNETWRRIADPLRVPTWDPGIERVEPLDAGPPAVGQRYRVRLRIGPFRMPVIFKVAALEPPHRIVLAAEGRWIRAVDDVIVEANGTGARVTWKAELWLRKPLALTGALWRPGFVRYARRAMAGLRGWLEG
jgi:carbon monoxide dehydrogenase subunit G